ncbi:contact-dependent growth inhibition system immunity protein [Streptomyces youssoufiensis]
MPNQELSEFFRLSGARDLLTSLSSTTLPTSAEERNRALQPALRAAWTLSERGGRTLYEVAAQIREVSHIFATTPEGVPDAVRHFPRASSNQETAATLLHIADYVENWLYGVIPKLKEATPTRDEINVRFPHLNHLLQVYFGQDGIAYEDDETTEVQGLEMYVEGIHPTCPWLLPGLVGECHEALALFHDEDSLFWFFQEGYLMGSGSLSWTEWLPLIADTMTAHMREHHSYRWRTLGED